MEPVRVLWSLASSDQTTTIIGAGNSGGWTGAPNAEAALDLRYVDDLSVLVAVTGTVSGASPQLSVQLDLFDDLGNLVTQVGKLASPLTGQNQSAMFSVGKHNANQVVLTQWGRISWSASGSGASFAGVQISAFGR
jgi:hypothetical protein